MNKEFNSSHIKSNFSPSTQSDIFRFTDNSSQLYVPYSPTTLPPSIYRYTPSYSTLKRRKSEPGYSSTLQIDTRQTVKFDDTKKSIFASTEHRKSHCKQELKSVRSDKKPPKTCTNVPVTQRKKCRCCMCRTRNSRLTRFFQSVVTCFGQCYFSITNCFTWVYYDTCIGRTVSNCLCYTGISICFCCCVQCFYAFQYLAEYLSRPSVKLFQPVIKFFRLLLLTRRYPTVVLDNIIMNQSSANLSPLEFKDIYLNFKGPEEMINAQVLIDWCTIEINRLQMKKHLNFKEVDRKFSQIQQVINIIDTNVSPVTEQCYLNPKEKKKTLQSYQKFLTFYHKAKPIILKKINKTSRIKSSFSPIVALILLISLPLCIICSIPLCLMKINLMYTIDVMTRNMEVNLPVSVGKNKPSCFIFCCSHCCPRDEDAHCDCYCMPLCSQNGTEMVEMSDLKCQDVPGFNETVFNNPYQSCDDKNLNLSCPPFDNPSFNASCQICDDKAFNTSYQASNVTTLTELNATTSNNTDISYRRCMCIELKDENNDKQLNDNEKKELQNIKNLLSIDKEDINKKENTMKTEKKP